MGKELVDCSVPLGKEKLNCKVPMGKKESDFSFSSIGVLKGNRRDDGDTVAPSSRWDSKKKKETTGTVVIQRNLIFLILSFTITFTLFSDYQFERCTFNAAGGQQSNGIYSVTTAVAEKVQGSVTDSDYDGFLGFLFPQLDIRIPIITSIDDVPDDQGREVQIVWNKCGYDDEYAVDTYYSLWRLDEDFEVVLMRNEQKKISSKKVSSKTKKLHSESIENIFTEPYLIIELAREFPKKTYFWQRDDEVWTYIGETPALQYDEYSYIASTLADSSETDIHYSTFKVVYHDLYEYYESEPDSGYSLDNIPPDETRIAIAQNGSYMRLSWEEVEYGTFEGNRYPEINGIWYRVYASDEPYFDCDVTTYLNTVIDLEYDYPLTGEDMKFFKVVVSDKP